MYAVYILSVIHTKLIIKWKLVVFVIMLMLIGTIERKQIQLKVDEAISCIDLSEEKPTGVNRIKCMFHA